MVIGKGGEGDGGFPVVADFDVEMELFDDEEPSSSSTASTSTNSTQRSQRGNGMNSGMKQLGLGDVLRPILPTPSVSMTGLRGEKESAFHTFLVTSAPGASFNSKDGVSNGSGIDGKKATSTYTKRTLPTASRGKASTQLSNAFGTNVRNAEIKAPPVTNEMAVPPSLLELRTNKTGQVIVPLVLDPKGNVIRPSPSELQRAAMNAPAPTQGEEEEEHDVGGELGEAALAPSPFFKYRPYRCNKPGCTKTYKQANGLKYHLLKGQCNFDANYANAMDRLAQEEIEDKPKAFACVVGDGCKKRYKHMTGLRVSLGSNALLWGWSANVNSVVSNTTYRRETMGPSVSPCSITALIQDPMSLNRLDLDRHIRRPLAPLPSRLELVPVDGWTTPCEHMGLRR